MEYNDLIRKRVSVRSFKDTPVPPEKIRNILEAGSLAPSQNDLQNWMFGVITDPQQKRKLGRATQTNWVSKAPLMIAVCSHLNLNDGGHEDDFSMEVDSLRFAPKFINHLCNFGMDRCVSKLWVNNAALPALVQMHLAAQNEGLGGCIVSHVDIDKASKYLKLPPDWACMFLFLAGYTEENKPPAPALKVEGITFENNWTESYF
jgi:nitroreductase